MGTRPKEEEKKWKNCALAKVLVNEDTLSSTEPEKKKFAIGIVNVPKELGFGFDAAEQYMLLSHLPLLTADMAQRGSEDPDDYQNNRGKQLHKTNMFAKVIDLRNANAKGIAYVNRRRIIHAFSTPENSFDTGRTEVQGTQPNQVRQICLLLNLTRYYSRSYNLQNSKCMEASLKLQK